MMAKSTVPVLEFGPGPVPDSLADIGENSATAKGNKGFRLQHFDHLTRLVCDEVFYALPMPEISKQTPPSKEYLVRLMELKSGTCHSKY